MTNEELDAARAEEVWRVRQVGESAMNAYRRLVRTGWTPAPKVDPISEAVNEAWGWRNPHADVVKNLRQALAKHNLAIVEIREQDKAEPVAPVPVDRATAVFEAMFEAWDGMEHQDKPIHIIRTYGDERERAGIEAARVWVRDKISYSWADMMRRHFFGGAGDAR